MSCLITLRRMWKIYPAITKRSLGMKKHLNEYYKIIYETTNLNMFSPTAEQVLENKQLDGKTCLITGASSGLGLESARVLAARGCRVLAACRNTYQGLDVTRELGSGDLIQVKELNLASLKSVKSFSDELIRNGNQLDMVLLNAGVFGVPWARTEDGLETIFQVNFLGQLQLLLGVERLLAPAARVVFVTSESHRRVNWSPHDQIHPREDMLSLPEHEYTSIKAYNISKLCSFLAMQYLGHRWLGSGRSVFCAHPGTFVKTQLCRHWWPYEALYTCMIPFAKTVAQAAATPVYCATSDALTGKSAVYYKDCARRAESDLAQDSRLAFRVMDLCRSMLSDRVGQPIDNAAIRPETAEVRDKQEDEGLAVS